jgi:chaperone modulatory protein CbpM
MLTRSQLVASVEGVSGERLTYWIEMGFIVPERGEGEQQFADIDIARVRLLHDLEADLDLDTDSIALLLSLLDQVYALRSRMRVMTEAIARQPPEVREAICALLSGRLGGGEDKGGAGGGEDKGS